MLIGVRNSFLEAQKGNLNGSLLCANFLEGGCSDSFSVILRERSSSSEFV